MACLLAQQTPGWHAAHVRQAQGERVSFLEGDVSFL